MTDPDGLLMIEPTRPVGPPVSDEYVDLAKLAFAEADPGRARFRGFHACVCGEISDNRDWHVRGMQTNSLLVHYVERHRGEVPEAELRKLEAFRSEVKTMTETETSGPGERAIVQLAGCLMAAEGNTELDGKGLETYGWSPAYQAVVELRKERDQARAHAIELFGEDPKKLTPAEAVFGVLAWLSTRPRKDAVTFSAHHDAAPAAEAAKLFCEANALGECRESWPEGLIHPVAELPS